MDPIRTLFWIAMALIVMGFSGLGPLWIAGALGFGLFLVWTNRKTWKRGLRVLWHRAKAVMLG